MDDTPVYRNGCSFLSACIGIYEQLQNDIQLCKRKKLDKETEIGHIFEIANDYLFRLIKEKQCYQFTADSDEIFFFKKLKPLFLAEKEICGLLSHAEINRSSFLKENPAGWKEFLARELKRQEKFAREHADFYDYMRRDGTERDSEFFLGIIDEATSPAENLLGAYLALNRYQEFLQREWNLLDKNQYERSGS